MRNLGGLGCFKYLEKTLSFKAARCRWSGVGSDGMRLEGTANSTRLLAFGDGRRTARVGNGQSHQIRSSNARGSDMPTRGLAAASGPDPN